MLPPVASRGRVCSTLVQRWSAPVKWGSRLWALPICSILGLFGLPLGEVPGGIGLAKDVARPNIILLVADDQGWGDVGYQGHPVLKTPHLDEAARSGLRFDRFYAQAPVCSPTRATLLTGRHPNRMGVFTWGYPIRPQEITLAKLLREAGYATGHFGKWHLGSVYRASPVHPGRMGFERWVSSPNFFDNNPIFSDQGTAVPFQGESSMVTVQVALEWIRQQVQTGRPFFAMICFGSPHAPHQAAEEDRALYQDQPPALREFYGEITGIDRAFGVLRRALAEMGIRENTILWYTSDNGALPKVGWTGGFRGNKGQIYEGGLLVPTFLEWPAKIRSPRVTRGRCCSADIFPTILEIVGIEPPSHLPLDGISLVPLIEGKWDQRPTPLGFWNYPAPGISTPSAKWMGDLLAAQEKGGDLPPDEPSQRAGQLPDPPYNTHQLPGHAAWIEGDWKLHRIENAKGKIRWELYNLQEDPAETTDRAAEEPERLAAMQKRLEAWLRSVVESLNGADYAGRGEAPSLPESKSR
jgi:arylsulfatase A-like enzyme